MAIPVKTLAASDPRHHWRGLPELLMASPGDRSLCRTRNRLPYGRGSERSRVRRSLSDGPGIHRFLWSRLAVGVQKCRQHRVLEKQADAELQFS